MDYKNAKRVKSQLSEHQTQAQKKLGQNFLADKGAVSKFLETASIRGDDIVVEIGPGTGILTLELAKAAKKVIAIEKDEKMAEILRENLKGLKNVEIIQGDIRYIDSWKEEIRGNYKVAANIPFYLTAFLIRSLLENDIRPQDMTLIIQKEVAQRICAKAPHSNLLAVCVQFYAKPKIISYISKKSFWPRPKVDSAIIKIVPHNASPHQSVIDNANLRKNFFKIVRAGFCQPRKQIINTLSAGLKTEKSIIKPWLLKNNIDPTRRAETLDMEDWIKLMKDFII